MKQNKTLTHIRQVSGGIDGLEWFVVPADTRVRVRLATALPGHETLRNIVTTKSCQFERSDVIFSPTGHLIWYDDPRTIYTQYRMRFKLPPNVKYTGMGISNKIVDYIKVELDDIMAIDKLGNKFPMKYWIKGKPISTNNI